MITIRNLNINFDKPLFINQNLQIKDNCVTLVVGESGCGKTTLLYKIGDLGEFTYVRATASSTENRYYGGWPYGFIRSKCITTDPNYVCPYGTCPG